MAMACLSRLSMLLKYTLLSVMFFMALKEERGVEGEGGLVSISKGFVVLEHTHPDRKDC